MSEQLKPCPFCGNPETYKSPVRDGMRLGCGGRDGCGVSIIRHHGRNSDINERLEAAWNTRAPSPADKDLQATNAELLEALRKLSLEVDGLSAFECEIRQAMGNTNFQVITEFNERAKTAIAKARKTT